MELNIEQILNEVSEMREGMVRIMEYISKKEQPQQVKEKTYPLPQNPKVTKDEAASILLVSPRHLQRIRKKIGLKWRKEGRDTMYFLDSIVNAIRNNQLSWSPIAYDKIINRISKLPIMPRL